MTVGICDDNAIELETLAALVADHGRLKKQTMTIRCFRGGEDFLAAIASGETFDIIFLDIYMGNSDGVAVAREIRKTDDSCAIIFTTSSRERAIEGYGVRALQYLLKPITGEHLADALDQAIDMIGGQKDRTVQVMNRQGTWLIPLDDIEYAESAARVVTVHRLDGEDVSFYGKLDDFEKKCADGRFLRTHKSFLVNLDHARAIVNSGMILKSGTEIGISINITRAKEALATWTAGRI